MHSAQVTTRATKPCDSEDSWIKAHNTRLKLERCAAHKRLLHFRCHEAKGTGCLSLKGLCIGQQPLNELLAGLEHVVYVYMSSCQLAGRLPDALHALPHLRILDLSDNQLTEAPTLPWAETLTVLDLSMNRLTVLPPAVCQLGALQEMNIAQNDLVELPAELCRLPQLCLLDASHNLLRTLPNALCSSPLSNMLQVLRLGSNVLKELPADLGCFQKLQELDVQNNDLSRLPTSARSLLHLQVFHHSGNRWQLPRRSDNAKQQLLDSSYGVLAIETVYQLAEPPD